jgi:Protein of unknown function (DUF2950)
MVAAAGNSNPSRQTSFSTDNRCGMKNKSSKSAGRAVAATLPAMFVAMSLGYGQTCLAASPGQTTFASAEAGCGALFLAVEHHDDQALTKILGAGEDLVSSGDPLQDSSDRQQFIQKYQEMHRLAQGPDGDTILYIGAENWPFPIPLVSKDGVWRFDPNAGRQEVLFRQIGEDEITAIDTCRDLVLREEQPAAIGKTDSVVATLLAELEHGKGPVLVEGYNFRILTGQSETAQGEAKSDIRNGGTTGGFALIAYPVAYRLSGVMSFIVNQDGVVYQKDFGPDTAKQATAMTRYQPDQTWAPVPNEL